MVLRRLLPAVLLVLAACVPRIEAPAPASPAPPPDRVAVDWEVLHRFRVIAPDDQAAFYADYDAALLRPDQRGYRAQGPASRLYRTAWVPERAAYAEGIAFPARWTISLTARGADGDGCVWRLVGRDGKADRLAQGCTAARMEILAGPQRIGLSIGGDDFGTVEIEARDILLVSLGDSYASGEGAPHMFHQAPTSAEGWGEAPQWWDRRCHRSLFAGPALAAARLARDRRRQSVTFLSFACSGATINSGILGYYPGIGGPATLRAIAQIHDLDEGIYGEDEVPPQIDAMEEALCPVAVEPRSGRCPVPPRIPDAVLLSVGGNDLNFSDIVMQLLVRRCGERCVQVMSRQVEEYLETLSYDYRRLANRLRRFSPRNVLITEYPDPTHRIGRPWSPADPARQSFDDDRLDNYCGSTGIGKLGFDTGIRPEEAKAAYANVIVPLARNLFVAAGGNGWRHVGGMVAASRGYCAADTWFNDILTSLERQNNVNGAMHPNLRGQDQYAVRIRDALGQALPGGDDSLILLSRVPGTAP